MITWVSVSILATLSVVEHASDRAAHVRARVTADAVALAAVVSPEHGELVAQANHAAVQQTTDNALDQSRRCVEIAVGGSSARACAELTTPTLDD